ncbi:MAG: TIGR03915 family putative DNA repair protein [Candidatus Wallbacteria bacterium]
MLKYVYDGSFDGMLTAAGRALKNHENCPEEILADDEIENDLFAEYLNVKTDKCAADLAIQEIIKAAGFDAMQYIFYAFLTEEKNIASLILKYIKLCFKCGRNVNRYLHDDTVNYMSKLERKVTGERHRLLGLLRFQKVENEIYYAPVEPDNNIVGLIAPHFVNRLPGYNFIIHDLKRGIAAMHQAHKKNFEVNEIILDRSPELSAEEIEYQNLWKVFFQSIPIKSRINPKLQKRCMPARYWKHMTEMN